MKNLFTKIKRIFLLLALCFCLVGCEPKETVSVPVMPKFVPALTEDHKPLIVNQFDIEDEIYRLSKAYGKPQINLKWDFQDMDYIVVDHEWMLEIIKWWDDFKWSMGMEWHEESFDCDNFADFLSSVVDLSNKNVKGEILIGSISVAQKNTFGGVPAGNYHALNFFVSNKGIFVLEPQGARSTVIELEKYPNIAGIYKINFN